MKNGITIQTTNHIFLIFTELFCSLKDKIMNSVYLNMYFIGFSKIENGQPIHIEAESGIVKASRGGDRNAQYRDTRYRVI